MTAYMKISTADLIDRWFDYGMDTSLVVYMDVPHQIRNVAVNSKATAVVTDRDTFIIPHAEKMIPVWRILAGS